MNVFDYDRLVRGVEAYFVQDFSSLVIDMFVDEQDWWNVGNLWLAIEPWMARVSFH